MKPYTEDSFVDAGSLPALEPVLQSWIKVQRDYQNAMSKAGDPGERAWYHRHEPTCVGFLSVAAWQCNGVSIEEWQTKKRLTGNRSKKEYREGFCDIYIHHNGTSLSIEAKRIDSDASGKFQRKHIENVLQEAVDDASNLDCAVSEQVGVLFVFPNFPPHKHENMQEKIARWLQDVASIKADAMAWTLEPRKEIKGRSDEHICPGIVLLARTPPNSRLRKNHHPN